MASAPTMISVEECLRISSHPDCEYVHGFIKHRAVPEYDHAAWQGALIGWFGNRELGWNIRVFPSLRMRIAIDNYRVPDITILSKNAPREQITTHPPLAVFEILSPTDAMTDVLEKLADYEQMGIAAIWLIEPKKSISWQFRDGRLAPSDLFALPGTSFTVPIKEIAALLD